MDDSFHATTWTQELSTGQTAILAVGDDERSVTFTIVAPSGTSSIVPVRERLEQLYPFVIISARKAAKVIGMDVAYAFSLGSQLQCHAVDSNGKVRQMPAQHWKHDAPPATSIGPI